MTTMLSEILKEQNECMTVRMWSYSHEASVFSSQKRLMKNSVKNIRSLPVTSDLHLPYLIKPGTSNPWGTGPEVCSTKCPLGFWIFSFKKIEICEWKMSQISWNQYVWLQLHDKITTLECSYKKCHDLLMICIQLYDLAAIHFIHL